MNKSILLGAMLLCLCVYAHAQTVQSYIFVFPIQDINLSEHTATIDIGSVISPDDAKTIKGEIIGLYNAKQKARNITLATCSFHAMDKGNLTINYQSNEIAAKYDDIQKGDLAVFKLKYPVPSEHTILFDIARYHIGLQSVYDKELYNIKETLSNADKALEQGQLEVLLKETKFVADAMRQQMKSPPVTKGKFKGMDLFTAMESSDIHDLRWFLHYVKDKPAKYMGHNWRFSEIYATWVDEGTPSGEKGLLEHLKVVNDKKFNELIASYSPNRLEQFIDIWRGEAADLIEINVYEEATVLLDICQKAAIQAELMSPLAWCYFNRSQIFEQQEKYDVAVLMLSDAADLFKDQDDKAGIMTSYNNLGNMLNKIGDYKSAISYLSQAYELNKPLLAKNSPVINGITALILRNLGDSYVGNDQHKKALKTYEEALALIEFTTENRIIKRKATIYYKMSELYKKMGKTDKATTYENKAFEVYRTILESNEGNG